jgi:hypothetical protein
MDQSATVSLLGLVTVYSPVVPVKVKAARRRPAAAIAGVPAATRSPAARSVTANALSSRFLVRLMAVLSKRGGATDLL